MVNATIPFLLNNMSYWIGQGIIGGDTSHPVGLYLLGAIILITFLLFIWNAKLGMFGVLVILPPLLIILSSMAYIPTWLTTVMWVGIGFVVGWIVLEMWRENR